MPTSPTALFGLVLPALMLAAAARDLTSFTVRNGILFAAIAAGVLVVFPSTPFTAGLAL